MQMIPHYDLGVFVCVFRFICLLILAVLILVAAHEPSLAAGSGGFSCGAQALNEWASVGGLVALQHVGSSRTMHQTLHLQADSEPLDHQRSPLVYIF